MQVLVNCKTKQIDYAGNYRMAFQARIKSKKTFLADYQQDKMTGDIVITKLDDGQAFPLESEDIAGISFFLNDERPYVELVRLSGTGILSFTIAPVDDNLDLGQAGVIEFREGLDLLAESSRVPVAEYIDPNPLKLCPDGVRNMEELIAIREAEMAGTPLTRDELGQAIPQIQPSADEDFSDVSFDVDSDDELPVDAGEDEGEEEPLDFDDIDEYEYEEDDGGADEDDMLSQETIALPPVSGYEDLPPVELDEASAQEADSVLAGIQEQFEQEKESRLAELDSMIEGEEEEPEVPDGEYVDGLLDDLGKLGAAADKIDQELCDYDDVLARNKMEQSDFLARINQMDVSSSEIVTGLIKMLQEQTDHNEALNATVKKEQILKRHFIEQLSAANDKVEEQSKTLDEVRRRLRFSQENQRKSEKFVTDARAEVKKVVDDANKKISQALERVADMQQQVKDANALTEAANADRERAIASKLAAERLRDEAMKFVDDEKERTSQIMDEFNNQLDSFTAKTLAKVKSQVERADAADQRYATATAKIADLESTLSEAKNKVFDLEMLSDRHDEDLAAKDEEISGLGEQIEALHEEYKNALADKDSEHQGIVAQLTEQFQQALAEMEEQLTGKQAELDEAKAGYEVALAAKDENMAALVAARGNDLQAELSNQNMALSEQLAALSRDYEAQLAEKDEEIARLASAKQTSEADYGDLMVEYNANKEELGNSGKMLSELEAQLVEARGRIAELESSKSIEGYSDAQVDEMVSAALEQQSDDTEAAIQARDAVMIAGEKLMTDIQNILSMASSGFGGRKKVKEVEQALAAYTSAYEAARAKSPTNVRAADFDMALEELDAQAIVDDGDDIPVDDPWEADKTQAMNPLDFEDMDDFGEDFDLDSIDIDVPMEEGGDNSN